MQLNDIDFGDDDLPTGWAVPITEDEDLIPLVRMDTPHRAEDATAPVLLLFREAEATPEAGFHPHLRRFDDVA